MSLEGTMLHCLHDGFDELKWLKHALAEVRADGPRKPPVRSGSLMLTVASNVTEEKVALGTILRTWQRFATG